jgi:hypothetical protein
MRASHEIASPISGRSDGPGVARGPFGSGANSKEKANEKPTKTWAALESAESNHSEQSRSLAERLVHLIGIPGWYLRACGMVCSL